MGDFEDSAGHEGRLIGLGVGLPDENLAAVGVLGPEGLALAPLIVGNHLVGGLQNGLGGAVILLQPNHLSAGMLLFKVEDIFDSRAAEAINALIVVSHHAEILVAARQQRRKQVLEVVGVLVLVDQDVAELPLVVAADLLILL